MTSYCLCAKIVNNISRNFNLCDFQTQGYTRIHLYVQYCIRMEITVLNYKLCGRRPSVLRLQIEFTQRCIMDICNCVILYISTLFVACGGVLTGETGTLTFPMDRVKRLSVCNSLCFCVILQHVEGYLQGRLVP